MIDIRPSPASSRLVRCMIFLLFAVAFLVGVSPALAQAPVNPATKAGVTVGSNAAATLTTSPRMRGTTMAQRKAAAGRLALRKGANPGAYAKLPVKGAHSNLIAGTPGAGAGVLPTPGELYWSGAYPNYAISPLPNPNDTVNCTAPNYCGIRKFVDNVSLPALPGAVGTPTLGQYMPIAVADTTTFPGSDYYEIELVEYHERLHSDLPAAGTQLRGYRQINAPGGPVAPHYMGPLIIAQSNRPVRVKFVNSIGSVFAAAPNNGNLFIPTDRSVLGSGLGMARGSSPYLDNRATVHLHGGNTPWISDGTPHQWTIPASDWNNTLYRRGDSVYFVPDMWFLNGVVVPQCAPTAAIPVTTNCSDPTSTNNSTLPSGATTDPGNGALTFYYTNQQSARLMFYHDHAYGTTRLNVYVGEASGYLIGDNVEADLVNGTNLTGVFTATTPATPVAPVIPAVEIPLVIQDKTFVPPNPAGTTVYAVSVVGNGSGYAVPLPVAPFTGGPTVTFTGGCQVEPTLQSASTVPAGPPVSVGLIADPFGLYIDGAVTSINLATYGSGCTSDPIVTVTDAAGGTGTGAAGFATLATLSQQDPTWDTATWGAAGSGNLWYPHVYMPNQWPTNPDGFGSNPMGRWDYASYFWPVFTNQYLTRGPIDCDPINFPGLLDCPGTPTPMNPAPPFDLDGTTAHLGVGTTASLTPEAFMDTPMVNGTVYPVLHVAPMAYRFRILSVGNDRSLNLSWFRACTPVAVGATVPAMGTNGYAPNLTATCPAPTVAGIAPLTEVGMVLSAPNSTPNYPSYWPTDGRDGGVPDPASAGPHWFAIGNEGGFLPAVADIPPAPVNYEYARRSITVTNTSSVSLNLMPAERADVIVDFTPYAGNTLILYNDAPAPYPAFDPRYDYYTGDPDQSGEGGAPTTMAGFGPNTRTIMQVKVDQPVTTATSFNLAALKNLLPAAFKIAQPIPVIPEPIYSKVYGTTFTGHYPTLNNNSISFVPIGAAAGSLPIVMPFRQKAIQELFELDYGRMNATLGTEVPLTNFNNQTTIPLGYVDPFTENIYDSAGVSAQPVGSLGDGSQLWEVVHNGVDSHAIHFHLYDVQVVDRVGWDGTVRVPPPMDQGWKDTVRMNPLEIDFVALRPMSMQNLPFPVPDSSRLLDVTRPVNTVDTAMTPFGPTNAAFNQMNSFITMGWEYVWHCHILGHEENDMMREQVFQVPPQTPLNVTAVSAPTGVFLSFKDMSLSEAGFTVERADDALFTTGVVDFTLPANPKTPTNQGWNTLVSYTDTSATRGRTSYFYRVRTFKPDADYWTQNPVGTPTLPNLVSAWSNVPTITTAPFFTVNPTSLTFPAQAFKTQSSAQLVTLTNSGSAAGTRGAFTISGANPLDFAVTSTTCTGTVAAGASCNIILRFTPQYPGARSATLVIPTNDPIHPTISVGLTGTGGKIALTVTASSQTINWGAAKPTITGTVTTGALVPPDTLAAFGVACTTTYTATSIAGTYPSTCSATPATNAVYTFTFVAGTITVSPIAAVITAPTGTLLPGTPVTFTWTTGGAALRYTLYVGTTGVGSNNIRLLSNTTATQSTVTIPAAMAGGTVYVRLYTFLSTGTPFVDYTYRVSGTAAKAVLNSPVPSTKLLGTTVTFGWTAGSGVSYYSLYVGTTGVGSNNIKVVSGVTALSASVSGLPSNSSPVYVRLYSVINGVSQFTDYTYTSF